MPGKVDAMLLTSGGAQEKFSMEFKSAPVGLPGSCLSGEDEMLAG